MEELLSWLQRVFGEGTPDKLGSLVTIVKLQEFRFSSFLTFIVCL